VVLSLLAERAMHGYELLKEYERQEVADWAPVSRPPCTMR
jgi:DNA-binding PadR family transcriptional regulator